MTTNTPEPALHERLERWVGAGLIDAVQAARIESAELLRAGSPPSPSGRGRRRTPLVIEALGYVGGALSIVAGFLVADRFWSDVPVGLRAVLAATATVVLGLAGFVVHADAEPAFGRLRGVLWAMSAAAAAALTYILAAQAGSVSDGGATTAAAAVATAYAGDLWRRSPSVMMHVATFVALAVTVGSGIAWLDGHQRTWPYGLGVWLLSAGWAVAAGRGPLQPRTAGYAVAAGGALFGALMTLDTDVGRLLGDLTAAALITAGVLSHRLWLLGLGVAGVLVFVPETVVRYLPRSVGGPVALLAVGLTLLGAALWLARRQTRHVPG